MKGVIFAELLHWVEEAFSPAVADLVIMQSRVASDGVYTSVGNYPHQEALALIGALAELTGLPVAQLANDYGFWLSRRFVELYPDARPPSVIAVVDGQELTVSYASHRPFAEVAFGLIRGYISYFDDALEVVRDEGDSGPHAARFVIRPTKA